MAEESWEKLNSLRRPSRIVVGRSAVSGIDSLSKSNVDFWEIGS